MTEPEAMDAPTRDSSTSTDKIVVNWSNMSSPRDGNSPILMYNLYWDAASDG